jgi:hypothetical protein
MPIVSVSVPHNRDPDDVIKSAQPHIQKLVDDFEGHDLEMEWNGRNADFTFTSLAFKISGKVTVDNEQITIDVDLPFAAIMFKDKVTKALTKNLTRAVEAGEVPE